MSSIGKRFKRSFKAKQEELRTEKSGEILAQVRELIDGEKYADAINMMPELVKLGCRDIDFFYGAAYCYFMLGDMDRAAQWVNTALSVYPAHVATKILLARICLMQERVADALAIFDMLLAAPGLSLTEQEQEDMEEILEYYQYSEEELIREKYPNVAAFLKLDEAAEAADDDEPAEEKIAEAEAAPEECPAEADSEEKAKAAVFDLLQRQGLLAKKAAEEAAEEVPEEAAAEDTGEAGKEDNGEAAEEASEEALILNLRRRGLLPEEDAEEAAGEMTAEDTGEAGEEDIKEAAEEAGTMVQKIHSQNISLKEKVRLFNFFAGGYFMQQKYDEARLLLAEAVKIDTQEQATIRNMAYLLLAQGKSDEAFKWAAKLPMADFGLLLNLR